MSIVGWSCLAIYSLVVAGSFYSARNATGEQKMGLIVPLMMIPAIVVFTLALAVAQYRGSVVAVSIVALLLTLPILFFGPMIGGQIFTSYLASRSQNLRGGFGDEALSELGAAIRANDPDKLKSLIEAGGTIDWAARDQAGFTLFGNAVREAKVATVRYDDALHCLRVMVDAGAPFQDDAMGPQTSMLADVVTGYDVELLKILLQAGADPNAKDTHGNPALIGMFVEANKAKVLLEAGAELCSLRYGKDPYQGYDALMLAALRARWDLAVLYLDHGCDRNHRLADGTSAKTIAEAADPDLNRTAQFSRDGFLRALAAR